jgi:hypothetical protein
LFTAKIISTLTNQYTGKRRGAHPVSDTESSSGSEERGKLNKIISETLVDFGYETINEYDFF